MAKSQTAQIALERLKPLSPKAMASVFADGWMTVWEGAIRSGKTVASLIAWLRYIQGSKERIFFMTGKSHGSLMQLRIREPCDFPVYSRLKGTNLLYDRKVTRFPYA